MHMAQLNSVAFGQTHTKTLKNCKYNSIGSTGPRSFQIKLGVHSVNNRHVLYTASLLFLLCTASSTFSQIGLCVCVLAPAV